MNSSTPEMARKAVIFLGSAGAGKSTLINQISGTNEANVSHSIMMDGTDRVHPIRDNSDRSLFYVDTPGLDSSNFNISVREKVQVDYAQYQILVVLVISKKAPRVTSYIKTFEETLTALVGRQTFVIYWTNEGVIDEHDKEMMGNKFKTAEMCESVDDLKQFLSNCQFSLPKTTQAKNAQRLASTPKAAKKMKPTGEKKEEPKFKIGFPNDLSIDTLKGNGIGKQVTASQLQLLIAEVIQIKNEAGIEYQNLKVMGDAVLKPIVLEYIYAVGRSDELTNEASIVLNNDADCAMPKFFDEHIAPQHNKVNPNETEISPHAKADVVEALLEHARRSHTKVGPKVFKFIMRTLLKSIPQTSGR
jgi:energy-coupling factor transporter ATP-binding protein EcfA2